MLIEYQDYLTFDNIYLWINIGIIPFWLLLIIIPSSKITQFFINSIIVPLILSATYVYVIYQAILLEESIIDIFNLYLSLESLYAVFASEQFLLIFWIHFLSINLFLGSWVSKDAIKYNIPRVISIITLVLIYFTGPIGLLFYWMFRIFYSKRLGFHD